MNFRRVLPLVALTVLALCGTALRADTFSFTASGVGINISGLLTAIPDGNPGEFKVIGISGAVNGIAITGLVPTAPGTTASNPTNGYGFLYDNLFFTSSPSVDYWGILFNVAGSTPANLFFDGKYEFYDYNGTIGPVSAPSVSQVPEPSSLALLGSGFLGFAGMGLRRFRA